MVDTNHLELTLPSTKTIADRGWNNRSFGLFRMHSRPFENILTAWYGLVPHILSFFGCVSECQTPLLLQVQSNIEFQCKAQLACRTQNQLLELAIQKRDTILVEEKCGYCGLLYAGQVVRWSCSYRLIEPGVKGFNLRAPLFLAVTS